MNDTWGFKSYDDSWKSPEQLIRNLIDIVSKGGNYLLNVGPNAEGEIPAASVERLTAIGRWTKVNGESIYGTAATPFATRLAWGRATRKPGKVYLEVFDWPASGTLTAPALHAKVKSASLIGDASSHLSVTQTSEGLSIKVPETAPNAIASVIVLETDGK